MEEKNKYIRAVEEAVVAAIRRKTALSLPNDPSAAGMSAQTIRRRFWEAICGQKDSLLSELIRIVDEINEAMDSVLTDNEHLKQLTERAEEATNRINESVRADRMFFRYSAYPDGRDYTDRWERGLNYIGVAVGFYEPEDASGYQWSLFSPGVYVGSGDMPGYADIQIDPSGTIPEDGGGLNGTNCEVISENATAGGNETVAGCKGFRIVGARDAGGGIGYYKLEGYEKGYEVGKAVSMCIFKTDGNEYMYDRAGTIVGIAGNEIGVQFQGSVVEVQLIGNPIEDQNTLWVPEQPEVGIIDIGVCAVAMGRETFATGGYSSSEGRSTAAAGKYAHTEGVGTTANFAAHAEGRFTNATGQSSHSEGYRTEATGDKAHAEGSNATASGMSAHAEGNGTTASGARSHAEGENTNATAKAAHAEGNGSEATEEGSHAEGITTHATGSSAHAEGKNTNAVGQSAHAEGDGTKATNRAAHAEGVNTTASGNISHVEGYNTKATEEMAHAEGANTTASGKRSHAEGNGTTASGSRAHAEGDGTTASGMFSHAEGYATTASGDKSHAEGASAVASGSTSHAEGNATHSKGGGSHAEGYNTTAKGDYSHAEGYFTISNGTAQHVQGKYNAEDTEGKYAFIIGNGGGENARSNAAAIRWDGTLEIGGVAISPAQLQKLLKLI